MPNDFYLGIKMRAFTAGLLAQSGEIDPREIEQLETEVEERLIESSRLRQAVQDFISDARTFSRDPVKLAEAGNALIHFIQVLNVPDPTDADRRDIHG